jgi:hypothetical protein
MFCHSCAPAPVTVSRGWRARLQAAAGALAAAWLTLQEALWRHAMFRTRGHSAISDLVAHVNLNACGGTGDEATLETLVRLRPDGTPRRKYRRRQKSKGPRLYCTRKDPFEAVWDEACQWLIAQPERTGKSVFEELQQRYRNLSTLVRPVGERITESALPPEAAELRPCAGLIPDVNFDDVPELGIALAHETGVRIAVRVVEKTCHIRRMRWAVTSVAQLAATSARLKSTIRRVSCVSWSSGMGVCTSHRPG